MNSSRRYLYPGPNHASMTGRNDVARISTVLASDDSISDYDFWRALKSLNNELYQIERRKLPIPINVIYARRILHMARIKRGTA